MSSTAIGTLRQTQLDELKKAFSVFDTDGNGVLTVDEIGNLLVKLADQEGLMVAPTQEECARLMRLMDKNGDGQVELQEFLATMEDWLREDDKNATLRRSSTYHTRESRFQLHKKVSQFFLQFRASDNIQDVRDSLMDWQRERLQDFVPAPSVDMEVDTYVDGERKYTDAEKQEALKRLRLANWTNVSASLTTAQTPVERIRALSALLEVLEVLQCYASPAERRPIADDLVKLFETCLELVPLLAQCLEDVSPEAQYLALRVLTLLAPGPRIAATPEDHWMHPSKAVFKRAMVDGGAVVRIITLLHGSAYPQVRRQALVCTGHIARDHEAYRDAFLAENVVPAVVQSFVGILSGDERVQRLRESSWLASVLCGDTHAVPPMWTSVRELLVPMAQAALCFGQEYTDIDVLANVAKALAFLLPGVYDNDNALVLAIIGWLGAPEERVVKIALWTIGKLLADGGLAVRFIQQGLLPHLRTTLSHPSNSIRYAACKVVAILAGPRGQGHALTDAGIVHEMLPLVVHDKYTRKVVVKTIKYLSRASLPLVAALVERESVVPTLFHVFTLFRSLDDVLANVYNFHGATFDFDILHDALKALMNILDAGQIQAELSGRPNAFVGAFVAVDLTPLDHALAVISATPAEQLSAWQHAGLVGSDGQSVQMRARAFLAKLGGDARAAAAVQPQLAGIASAADALLNRYFSQAPSTPPHVRIRFNFNGDLRMLDVPVGVRVDLLLAFLEQRYCAPLQLAVETLNGALEPIASQAALDKLAARAVSDGASSVQVIVSERPANAPAVADEGGDRSPRKRRASTSIPAGDLMFRAAQINMHAIDTIDRRQLFDDLMRNVTFTTEQVDALLKSWRIIAPSGTIDREGFEKGLRSLGINDALLLRANFDAFDNDGNGSITFPEFVVGLAALHKDASIDDRLSMLFRAYDLDGNGTVSPQEMFSMIMAAKEARGEPTTPAQVEREVALLFNDIDENKDGFITFDEFSAAVKKTRSLLAQLLPS